MTKIKVNNNRGDGGDNEGDEGWAGDWIVQ